MKRALWVLAVYWGLAAGVAWSGQSVEAGDSAQAVPDVFQKVEQSMVLILVGDGAGRVLSVSAGVVVRADGIVLTAYRPLKGAQAVQLRLRDGEVYDQVDLLGFDERRDVAALHFFAAGLASVPSAPLQGATPSEKVRLVTADGTMAWSSYEGVLGPVRLADEIIGAGQGYRVIQFTSPSPVGAAGGALLNARGELLGIVPAFANASGQQFAIPVESVAGLASQGLRLRLGNGKNLMPPAAVSNSVTTPDGQAATLAALANAQTLRVTSKTTFFTPFMLEKELLNDSEFRALGLNVVSGYAGGELLVTVGRPLFTYDFTYSVSDARTSVVLATGKITAIDGPHAAQGIAKNLVRELERARALQPAQSNTQDLRDAQR